LGTFPDGCVRFGLGVFTTEQDIHRTLDAVKKVIQDK